MRRGRGGNDGHSGNSRGGGNAPALIVLAATLLLSPVAFAQEADDEWGGLETIVVTAQKREQNLLEVPVAVSVIGAEQLETFGVADFVALARVAPSLTVNEGANTNNSTIRLRGIGTFAFSIAVEPSVSVIVDDVAVVQQAQAFNNLSDIERIEVLRGPQGTLFGKNASAGVVNIVTKAPSDELTVSVQGSVTNDDEERISANLSAPLGENFGIRLNGYYTERDGHIKNLTDDSDLNGEDAYGIRAKLRFDATENLDATFIFDHSQRDSKGTAWTYRNVPPGASLFGVVPAAAFTGGITPGRDNFNTRLDDNPTSENDQTSATFKINYDLGDFQLTSITSYQDWEYLFEQDVDGTDFNIVGAFTMGAINGGVFQSGPFSSKQFTQELRLTSASSDTFEYLVGIYYADADSDRTFMRGPILAANWAAESGTRSLAAFAQGTYYVTEQTSLTGGLRVNNEEIDIVFRDFGNNASFSGDDDDTAVTGKLALRHYLANDVMLFGSIATGYKGQGYDVSSGFDQSRIDNLVREETSVSYELGMKGRFLDNRVQLTATAFLTDYDDFQAQSAVIDPETLAVELVLNNVGELRTQGIEVELTAEPVSGLRFDANAAYINAEVRSYPGAQCYLGQTVEAGCIPVSEGSTDMFQDLAGKDLANSPDFKLSLGVTYEQNLPSLPFDLLWSAGYTWQDDVNFSLAQDPRTIQDSYGIVNVSVALVESDSARYRLTAFVNNLFDQEYVVGLANVGQLFGDVSVLNQILPRNAQRFGGVRLKIEF